jgi:hypothetical protein
MYLQGNPALEMAILMKHMKAITLLLQHGANVNMKNNKVRNILLNTHNLYCCKIRFVCWSSWCCPHFFYERESTHDHQQVHHINKRSKHLSSQTIKLKYHNKMLRIQTLVWDRHRNMAGLKPINWSLPPAVLIYICVILNLLFFSFWSFIQKPVYESFCAS